jgi:hypothetical protein
MKLYANVSNIINAKNIVTNTKNEWERDVRGSENS